MKPMQTPRFLVLLAAFNGSRWIEEQVETILRQRDVDVRVLIADDGSTDDTGRLLAKLNSSRVSVLVRSHSTGSAAQNFFALIRETEADKYDYVAFSDQDDIWHADKLKRAEAALRGGMAGYSSATTAFWDERNTRVLRQNANPTESDFLFEGAGQGCTFVLAAHFYAKMRAFLITKQRFTATLHYHDWATYALARIWGAKWVFDPEPSMMYRQHRQNDTGARGNLQAILHRIRLIATGWYKNQIVGIALMLNEADATNPLISEWLSLLTRSQSMHRRFKVAQFCVRGGRRRPSDRLILIVSALLGWI